MKQTLFTMMLFCTMLGHAQIEFEKGYYIVNSNERIECYIKNMDWKSNPVEFQYKLAANGEVKSNGIAAVKEFGIDSISKYKRYNVKIEYAQTNMTNLQKSRTPEWKEATIFLKALVEGNANLYAFRDNNIFKFFYETQDKPIEQLVYIKYQPTESGLAENNQFRQQLFNTLKCDKLTDKDFTNLEYQENQLVETFVKYNGCGLQKVTNYNAKDKREQFALRIMPGIYFAKLNVEAPQGMYNVSTEVDGTVFKFGIETEFILPYNKGTWSVFANPTYQKFDPQETYAKNDGLSNNGNTINYIITVDYTSIEIPVGVRRYFYLNKSSKIFVNAAYVFDFAMSSTLKFDNQENLFNGKKELEIGTRQNIALGVGFQYKRFGVEIRYNAPRNVLKDYLTWSGKYSSTGLLLSYKVF